MAKGKSTWKYNKLLTPRRNYFVGGGGLPELPMPTNSPYSTNAVDYLKPLDRIDTNIQADGGNVNMGAVSGGIAAASSLLSTITGAVQGVNEVKELGNQAVANIKAQTAAAQTSDDLDLLTETMKNRTSILSPTKKQLGQLSGGAIAGNALSSALSGAASGMSTGNPWVAGGMALANGITSIIGSAARNKEVNRQYKRALQTAEDTNNYNTRSDVNAVYNALGNKSASLNATYAAFGGELNTQGSDFTNGLLYINKGGSHESNPYEGVLMGMDQQGTPNLVEEGETIFNDYVFSKRLKVPNNIKKKYKLGGDKSISFADASKKLAKESEERPYDPISKRGLEAFMADLAQSQEELKMRQRGPVTQGDVNYNAYGGNVNKFYDGTSDKNNPVDANRYIVDASYPYGTAASNPDYSNWGTFNWGGLNMYDPTTGKYHDIYTDINFQNWLRSEAGLSFMNNWWANEANAPEYYTEKVVNGKKIKNKAPTINDLLGANGKVGGMYDTKYSDMHKFGLAALDAYKKSYAKPTVTERYLRTKDGDKYNTSPLTDWFDKWNDDGLTYLQTHEGRKLVNRTDPVWDEKNGQFVIKEYYEDKNKPKIGKHHALIKGPDGNNKVLFSEAMEGNMLDNFVAGETYQDEDGNDVTVYNPKDPEKKGKHADWLRYAPLLGGSIAVGLDAFGVTNKPDYREADALGNYAARSTGSYQPVRFNPIGNYLTYRPFDQQYNINNLNAQSAATRRAALQNAGLNRGAGMSAILAADYNAQNAIGDAYRQAAAYNEELKKNVEQFNRETNIANSEGMLKADIANQEARLKGWEANANLQYQAAKMRQDERQAANAAKSANFSGLFTGLGNLGMDEYTRRQQDFALDKRLFGELDEYLNWKSNKNKNKAGTPAPTNSGAYGGKLIKKTKKGFTF